MSLLPSCSRLHASLPINLPSWDTPRRTTDDILSTGCACCFHVEQDGTFCRLFVPPIARLYLHRVGELIEPVQFDTTPITPTPATVDPILEPPPRSSSPIIHRPLPRYPRRQINNDNLIVSIDQVGQKLVDCLSIIGSALTTLVQRRPPSNSDLSKAD